MSDAEGAGYETVWDPTPASAGVSFEPIYPSAEPDGAVPEELSSVFVEPDPGPPTPPAPMAPDPVPGSPPEPSEVVSASPAPSSPTVPAERLAQLEKEAYTAGFEQGEKAGMELGLRKMEELRQRYEESVRRLAEVRDAFWEEHLAGLRTLAIEMARHVVGTAVETHEEVVEVAVRQVLEADRNAPRTVLRVHPSDAEWLRERLPDLAPTRQGLTLEPDDRISRGGCVAETKAGDWSATVESRMQAVEACLVES